MTVHYIASMQGMVSMHPLGCWIALAALFGVIEAATLGLTTIWFAGGALAGALACALHAPLWAQILVFVAVSLALLVFTRPLAGKYVNSRVTPTNVDSLPGRECLVTEDIDNLRASGQVSLDGQAWSAKSSEDEVRIPAGTKVTVVAVSGVRLIVEQTRSSSLP